MAKRDSKTGKFVSTKRKPKRKTVTKLRVTEAIPAPVIKPDCGKCNICGSDLERLVYNSRAKAPLYAIVCDNWDCNKYRYVTLWQY